MKPKDYIQNEEETKAVETQRGFTAFLTLPQFTCFLYYLEKISQVLDSYENCMCVCAYAEIFFTCIYHVPLKK